MSGGVSVAADADVAPSNGQTRVATTESTAIVPNDLTRPGNRRRMVMRSPFPARAGARQLARVPKCPRRTARFSVLHSEPGLSRNGTPKPELAMSAKRPVGPAIHESNRTGGSTFLFHPKCLEL